MRTNSAPTIRLKDYSPPAYTIHEVELNVKLDPNHTRVIATISVQRQKKIKPGTPLLLDGDELKLCSLSLNNKPLCNDAYRVSPNSLKILHPPNTKEFTLEIETELTPVKNKKLMGLYQSSGVYCTQCEAEGFRRITYFLDRPDVLAVYTVRMEADKTDCPVLLSNGNLVKKGQACTKSALCHLA